MNNLPNLTNPQFDVDFKPSEITIKNEDELKKLVAEVTKYYGSLVFTDENVSEAKKARTDLNKVVSVLETQRKAVKRQYNAPLTVFEDKLNNYTSQVKDVSQTISDSINEYDEKQREIRLEKLKLLIREMSGNYGVTPDEIHIEKIWLNKVSFTAKGEPTKKTVENIAAKMKLIGDEKKRIESNKKAIAKYAKAVGLDPESWTYLANEQDLSIVTDRMDQAIVQREERKQREEQQKAAQEAIEQANAAAKNNPSIKAVDTETGEIIETKPDPEPVKEVPFKYFKVFGDQAILDQLEDYLILQGYEYEIVGSD